VQNLFFKKGFASPFSPINPDLKNTVAKCNSLHVCRLYNGFLTFFRPINISTVIYIYIIKERRIHMKSKGHLRQAKSNGTDSRIATATAIAYLTAILCCFLLAFTVDDCENYSKDDSVPASISFTPPERAKAEGFWEIFSDSVAHLFQIGD